MQFVVFIFNLVERLEGIFNAGLFFQYFLGPGVVVP